MNSDDVHDLFCFLFWHEFLITFGIVVASILAPVWYRITYLFTIVFHDFGDDFLVGLYQHFVPGGAPFLNTFSHLDRSCSPGCVLGRPLANFGTLLAPVVANCSVNFGI